MSRVYSAKIAGIKATDEGLEVRGSVLASDAFFPFRDGIDAAAEAGVSAVIEPGGSVRDAEVTAAADEHGMAMVFTRNAALPALTRGGRRDSRAPPRASQEAGSVRIRQRTDASRGLPIRSGSHAGPAARTRR